MKVALSAALFAGAVARGEVYLHEDFSGDFSEKWVSPADDGLGKFELSSGKFHLDAENKGLRTTQDAKFYMAARDFDVNVDNTDKTLVVQLSVKHEQKIDCGGGYVKVYAPGTDLNTLNGESPYNIMFGPDICGSSKKMVHVIISKNGENHLINKKIACEADIHTHAYTLILKPDNTYSVLVDNVEKESGSLEDDWDILEPKEIQDPEQSKPEDWVEEKMIQDETDVKPSDWDDVPASIPDPDASKPEDWDDDMDGEYEIPIIPNPEYHGEWMPRMVENPDYKGAWEHPLIANPDFVSDPTLYQFNSGAIGIDLWQVKSGSIFDDILVTDDVEYAKTVAEQAIASATAEAAQKAEEDAATAAAAEEARKEQQESDESFVDEEDDDDDEFEEHDEL